MVGNGNVNRFRKSQVGHLENFRFGRFHRFENVDHQTRFDLLELVSFDESPFQSSSSQADHCNVCVSGRDGSTTHSVTCNVGYWLTRRKVPVRYLL